ncbi:MAG: colicin E3/pyocin S6 family cytotoxin [Planctomycetota bacterium]|nr:colicin E3/pyocin S6 family cytotoxin [Planctomycetota bacterium]
MYDPYGKATVLEADWSADADGASDVANARLFQGDELNAETGLYSSRVRPVYHPTLGVWASRDPAGDVDGSNLYQYCRSNPAAGTDPMGLCFGTAPYVDQYENQGGNIGPRGDTGEVGSKGPDPNAWTEEDFQAWLEWEDGGDSVAIHTIPARDFNTNLPVTSGPRNETRIVWNVDLTPDPDKGEFTFNDKLHRYNSNTGAFDIYDVENNAWRPETFWERSDRHWDAGKDVMTETVVRTLFEPVDWGMTFGDIYDDPANPWNYAGLLPFVPGSIKKVAKAGDKAADAVRRVAKIAKAESPVWQEAKPFRGQTKTNGQSGKARQYYEWDHTHGDIEVFDSRGKHLGSKDARTGKMTKPPDSRKSIKL